MVNRITEQKAQQNYIVVKCDGKQGAFRINEFSDAELNELKIALFTQLLKSKTAALAQQTQQHVEVICEFIRNINEELQNRFNEKVIREVQHG